MDGWPQGQGWTPTASETLSYATISQRLDPAQTCLGSELDTVGHRLARLLAPVLVGVRVLVLANPSLKPQVGRTG